MCPRTYAAGDSDAGLPSARHSHNTKDPTFSRLFHLYLSTEELGHADIRESDSEMAWEGAAGWPSEESEEV